MPRLKAKKAKYKYKNESAWLRAVYRNNKTLIDSKLSTVKESNKFKVFKELVNERKTALGETTYKAVQNLSKTEIFVTRKRRLQENVYKAIKSDKDLMRQFKQKTGRKAVDIEKFEWDYEDKVYKYDDVRVDISNSPYGIRIY